MSIAIYQRVAVTDAGDVIPGAEYTVINENTGVAAPIYSDRTGATLKTAPYFADSVGTIQFYIAQGTTYRVAASGGVGTYTDRYVYGISEAVLVQADGNVGIGTSSASHKITVAGSNNAARFSDDGTGYSLDIEHDTAAGVVTLQQTNSGGDIRLQAGSSSGVLLFDTAGSERVRIDSSGNLLVAKTAIGAASDGFEARASGLTATSNTNDTAFSVNRNGTDGVLQYFFKSGTVVGSIGSIAGGYLSISGTTGGRLQINGVDEYNWDTTQFYPSNDNQNDLGFITKRWDDIYATNPNINTSDRNEKQDILEITTAETAVAKACKSLLRSFRWIDAVEKKGDDARIHFGIIAQDLQDAFTAQGLDAGRYAMFVSSTWWEAKTEVEAVEAVAEVTDEDGNVTTEAVEAKDSYTRTDTFHTLAEAPAGATERTRLGVRYSELLAFIIAAI